MPAMKPGSGGPYATLSALRYQKKDLTNLLANAPLSRRKRREKNLELKGVLDELKLANAAVRALRKKPNPA